jgi:phosphopentomutase
MKPVRVLTILTSLVFLGATSMASAQAPKKATPEKATTESATMAKGGDSMMGHHTMEGEVTKVDAKKGWVDVKTAEGSMKLHYPPEALASIKKGDSVTVELGIKDNGPAPSGSVKSKTQ